LPSVVSGRYIGFLDPHGAYFSTQSHPTRGRRIDFLKNNHIIKASSDQFEPYRNKVPGLDFTTSFGGTLFRFPFRNAEACTTTKLFAQKPEPVSEEDIQNVIKGFLDDLKYNILFLRNIHLIELYEIGPQLQHPKKLACISVERSADRELRTLMKNKITERCSSTGAEMFDAEDIEQQHEIILTEENVTMGSIKQHKFLISEVLFLRSCGKDLRDFICLLKTLPLGGCAIQQDIDPNTSCGRLFCSLPLPDGVTHGLPVHFNGFFGLTDNRRDLKWVTTETYKDNDGIWNELLITQVISRTYVKLIEYCNHRFKDSLMVYQCLPDLDVISKKWHELLKPVFQKIAKKPIVMCLDGHKRLISEIIVNNLSDDGDKRFEVAILRCFENSQVASMPNKTLKFFQMFHTNEVRLITPSLLCKCISGCSLDHVSCAERLLLLEYSLRAPVGSLHNVALLPLLDGSWTIFDCRSEPSALIYFVDNHEAIVPNILIGLEM
ncbi:unnamed protein product, partial [Didymodactylos carnosus]